MALKSQVWGAIALSLATVALFESGTLPTGTLFSNENTMFFLTSIMELLTVCSIPLAMRLFKFKTISDMLVRRKEQALMALGTLRLQMICIPMVVNTALYYVSGINVAFGYMAIILLICLAFIYPTKSRCFFEVGKEGEIE